MIPGGSHTHPVRHDEHVHDAGRSVAPVDQAVALVAQRGREVPRAKPLVPDVVDAGTDQLRQDGRGDLRSRLEGQMLIRVHATRSHPFTQG